jgi:hypothetical protein
MVIFFTFNKNIIYNIILYIMRQCGGDVVNKLTTGANKIFGSVGDAMGAAGDITSSTAKTASQLVDVAGDTSVKVATGLGETATSGLKIVSATVGAVATTAARIQNSTEEMAKRRAEIERQKTASQVGKTTQDIAKIEATTNLELDRIQKEYEIEQQKLKSEQEINLDKINSEQREKLLNQKETTTQRQLAFNYGFKNNNPKPTDSGFKQTVNPFSKLCFSYIPQYFVLEDGTIIDIDFPETQPTDTRSSIITAINKDTRQEIQITFQAQAQKDWRGNLIYLQVPVIKFQDLDGQSKTLFGKMYYNLIYFPCGTTNRGGRRLRTNKRRRTYRRLRTNRSRTNKGRSNKRSRRR